MLRESLSILFPLFTEIRLKIKPNNAMLWYLSILLLIQNTLTVFFADQPSTIVNSNKTKDPGVCTLLAFLFIPWYNSSTFVLFDTGILFFLQLSLFALILSAVRKKQLGFYVSLIHLTTIYNLMLFLSYGISVPLYFRISHSLDYIFKDTCVKTVFSFILVLITTLFHFFMIYLKSVFSDQFDFIPESTFSLYEGKSSPLHRLIHCISVCLCFMLPIIKSHTIQKGVAFLTLGIGIVGFYFRVLPCAHYSIVGQFMDTSFLFFTAPILIIKSFVQCFEYYFIVIYVGINLFCFLTLYVMRKQVSKKSIEMFNIFANCPVSNSTFSPRSGISPHNYVTVIRVYALNIADPDVFEKFRSMQQLFDRRASIQIEIIRFLGLFPSKRAQMLDEIQNVASKSLYNRFMLHLFSEKLSALTMQSIDADRSAALDLYSAFAAKLCKYWKCRHKKRKFKAFTTGLLVMALRFELKSELKMLINKYPFDPKIRTLFVNFLIIANGDPEEIKNQKNILRELSNRTSDITDPLLHNVAGFNPRILRFLSKSERETCSCITSVRVKPVFGTQAETDVVQTLSKPPKSCIFTTFFVHIYISLLLIILISLLFDHEYKSSVISDRTFEVNNQTIERFYIGSATFFLPFTNLEEFINLSGIYDDAMYMIPLSKVLFENDTECFNYFVYLAKRERIYFEEHQSLKDIAAYAVSSSIEIYLKHNIYSICDLVNKMKEEPADETMHDFNLTIEALYATSEQIQLELRNFTKRDILTLITLLAFIGFAVVTFFYFFGFYIFLNYKMSDLNIFFSYLGSEERKNLIEEGKVEESWEIIKDRNLRNGNFEEVSVRSRNINFGLKPFLFNYLIIWLIALILLLLLAVPHSLRVQSQSELHQSFHVTYVLVKDVILLVTNILSAILGEPLNEVESQKYVDNIKRSDHRITDRYLNYEIITPDKKMTTISELVDKYLSSRISYSNLRNVFVPNLFIFARFCMIDIFVNEANTRELFHGEAVISLAAVIIFVIIIFLISGAYHSKKVDNSISKLFIFPNRYIKELHFKCLKDDNKLKSGNLEVPDNLLVITIITETKMIYSVSENSLTIINKPSSSLINTNFFDLFTLTEDNDPNFLVLQSADKKKNKLFKAKIIEKGQIMHYLLLDDSSKVLSNLPPNATAASQLANFMTPFFAEQFATENVRSVVLADSFFIFIKIKVNDVEITTIESVYASFFSQLTKSFANVKCIKVDGSLIELSISNNGSILTALFLLRDIVNNPKSSVGIHSILVDNITEARFTLNTEDEPCVECENKEIEKDETAVFQLEEGQIAFHKMVAQQLPEGAMLVGKSLDIVSDLSGQITIAVFSLSIYDFLSLMKQTYQ